jgi:hypothetical protein
MKKEILLKIVQKRRLGGTKQNSPIANLVLENKRKTNLWPENNYTITKELF